MTRLLDSRIRKKRIPPYSNWTYKFLRGRLVGWFLIPEFNLEISCDKWCHFGNKRAIFPRSCYVMFFRSVSDFDWTWITFLIQCNFEKRHPFYYFSDCSKLSRIFNNCSVNLIFSFLIRWISSSWAIFIWRWFLSSSSKDFWICWRLSRCRAAASRFLLRLRFRCSS